MSTLAKSGSASAMRTSTKATHRRHTSFKTKVMRTGKAVAQDPCTWIGAGVASAVAIPLTCKIQDARRLKMYDKIMEQEANGDFISEEEKTACPEDE